MDTLFFERIHKLPAGFSTRAIAADDAQEVTELVRKIDLAACGETSTSLEEIHGDITSTNVGGAQGSAVIIKDSAIVAVVVCFNEVSEGRGMFFDVFISPDLDLPDSTQITERLLEATSEYAQDLARAANLEQIMIKTALYEADAGFLAGLRNQNFEQHRIFWRMRRNVTEPLSEIKLPSGYSLIPFKNTERNMRELHALQSTVFMDYYDYSPMTFEAWEKSNTEGTHDPALWRVIEYEGKMIGFLMASNRFASEGFDYVASIGVAREHRSRGLAKALLMDLFTRDTEEGRIGTLLHGDSANPTGAMGLYESVGMKVDRVYLAFRKMVTVK